MPMFSDDRDNDDDDDLFTAVTRMADRLGIKGDKRETYIDDHMLEGGYRRVQTRESYARVQDDSDDQSGGNRWGFGRNRGQGSGMGGSRDRGGRDNDPDRY